MTLTCPCRYLAPLVLLGAVFIAPYGLLWVAEDALEEAPCASGELGAAAPQDGFFQGQRLADLAAVFPWTHERAVAVSTDAATACMDTFASGCDVIRDEAIYETRDRVAASLGQTSDDTVPHIDLHRVDWRDQVDTQMQASFCGDWEAWIDWVEGHDVDPTSACVVCSDPS